jgi:hypothetical protein
LGIEEVTLAEIDEQTDIPDHFFIAMDLDGKPHYVLCGSVYSFAEDALSESALAGIKALFAALTLDATPITQELKETAPVTMHMYGIQSARSARSQST